MTDRFVRNVLLGVVALWIVWFLHPFLARRMLIPWDAETVGQWGDTFGALNALMSTLAFCAVFYTIRLQQRQIDETQRDQHIQRFESSYFELLRLFREARAAIKFDHSEEYRMSRGGLSAAARNYIKETRPFGHASVSVTHQGDDAFKAAMLELRYWMRTLGIANNPNKKVLVQTYIKRIHDRHEGSLGPYFRLMYTILQRISEDEKLTAPEKARYGNLLRSQISSYEASIAGFNGLSPVSKDFSRLITEFRLLKYLPSGVSRRVLESHYPEEAFIARD